MSELADGWTDDQREAVKEFCLRSVRSLFLTENRGDLLEALNRMLEVSLLVHLAFVDEDELAELIDLEREPPAPGLWS